jgi:hypothetical protein
MSHVLDLSEEQIAEMVSTFSRGVKPSQLCVLESDSYGPHMHRTWVFFSPGADVVGSIERYWSGLKMICAAFGQQPRTFFFTEGGMRTTNRGLKGSQ